MFGEWSHNLRFSLPAIHIPKILIIYTFVYFYDKAEKIM